MRRHGLDINGRAASTELSHSWEAAMRNGLLMAAALTAIAGAATVPTAPAAAQNWQDVTCQSWNFREASCPTPGASRVQLLRVIAGDCVEGRTWIHDGRMIRVRGGCRAVFRTNAGGWGAGGFDPGWNGNNNGPGFADRTRIVRCESWNYRDQRCDVPGRIGGARVLRVLGGDCRDGATWRWDRNALFVRNGCRAEFEVLIAAGGWNGGNQWPGGGPGYGNPAAITSITCESWNYRPAQCDAPRGREVQLQRVIAGDCVRGRSWGVRPGQVWVNGGCRAVFALR
jgi:hypothetical protein